MAAPLVAAVAGGKLLGGFLGKKAKDEEAKARRAMARYNAQIIRQNAKTEAEGIAAESNRLVKSQREFLAQQRMSSGSRGGLVEGGLPTAGDLGSYIEVAKEAQLDLLEKIRHRDIAIISGENAANKAIYEGELAAQVAKAEGKASMMSGITGAVSMFI